MDGSIRLSEQERKTLLEVAQTARAQEQWLRARILLALADGWTWNVIASVRLTSSSTINRWRKRYLQGGLGAVLDAPPRSRPSRFAAFWIALVFRWVTTLTPRDFGFYRSRWCCSTLVLLLQEDYGLQVGRETVRCWWHQQDLVYRRPRPVLGRKDPQHCWKVRKTRALLRHRPAHEVPCSRRNSTGTPIPKSVPCGCGGDNKPRW
jgi:transposase